MMKKNILWFREIGIKDIETAGGKGASLGEMSNQNFPIPNGFVVTANAYFEHIKKTGIQKQLLEKIDFLDVEDTEELQKQSAEARKLILETEISPEIQKEIKQAYLKLGERSLGSLSTLEEEYVAVRSSATAEDLPSASFAGQQETFLNVKGYKNVIEAVKKCWASLFTARAVYYRRKQKFSTSKTGIAAIVQKMVEAEISGVMFTIDPTTNDKGKIVIEAGFGLGEAIVSGALTPDTYVVSKGDFEIEEKRISKQTWKFRRGIQGNLKEDVSARTQEKQKLSDSFIVQLAKIGKQIERHYGVPQDIEWALENARIFIVQSRPVTTFSKQKIEERKKALTSQEPLLKGIPASPGIATGKAKVVESIEEIAKVEEGDILITKMTSPDWVQVMEKAIAIVTDEGGKTSHAAIVSRELGIPCIVGTELATKKIVDGTELTIDAFNGLVYKGRVALEKKGKQAEEKKKEEAAKEKSLEDAEEKMEKAGEEEKKTIAEALEQKIVKVKVNVALPEAAERAAETGAEGVGLLRAEHMISKTEIHPAEMVREGKTQELKEIIKQGIKAVAEHFKEKPVWYRTLDARTDEFRNLKGGEQEDKEENPMLGFHGIRRSIKEKEILKAEFKAVKELSEEGFKEIGVMLAFVQSREEVRKAKEIAQEENLWLGKDAKFGVMIETPASVWIIEELIEEGIDFASFGTNDLTQLTLGIDRNNEKLQEIFDEMHPAVMNQIAYVIYKCNKKGIETSICGQAGSNPEMAKKLTRMGISSISANIDSVEEIKKTVEEEQKKVLEEAIARKQEQEEKPF